MASNVFEAITAVMGDVAYVQKEGQMTAGPQRYSFVRAEDLVGAVRKAMVTHGLCMVPSKVETVLAEVFETSNQKKMNRVVLSVQYTLAHGSSNTQTIVASYGEGADTGDKACNKAMTAAEKYALRQAFLIETGDDDPDKHASADQERAALPAKSSGRLNGKHLPEDAPNADKYANALSAISKATTQDQIDRLMLVVAQRHNEGVFDERQLTLLTQQAQNRCKGFEMMEKAPY